MRRAIPQRYEDGSTDPILVSRPTVDATAGCRIDVTGVVGAAGIAAGQGDWRRGQLAVGSFVAYLQSMRDSIGITCGNRNGEAVKTIVAKYCAHVTA